MRASMMLAGLSALALGAQAAGPAPAGALGTISVEYRFESTGEKSGNDNGAQWKIERWATLTAEVVAQKPTPFATMVVPDDAKAARQQQKTQQAATAMQPLQPMMASAEKIVAACKGDEACVEREVQKMAMGLSGNDVARARNSGEQAAALTAQGPAGVQLWRPKSQRGEYRISEDVKRQFADPFCTGKPGMRCRRSEARSGHGAVPGAGNGSGGSATAAMAEVDHAKNTLTIVLPVWMNALPVQQTVQSDYPTDKDIGTRSVPSAWRITDQRPITVPLSARGEQVREVVDAAGFAGKLTVRWGFVAGR